MKIKNLKKTCNFCPSQWEFITERDIPVYVRYRWGYLSIRIGKPKCNIISAVRGKEIYGKQMGDGFDGVIDWNEVEPIIKKLKIKGDDIETITAKSLRNEYEIKLANLKARCQHKKLSNWMEECWAIAHSTGFEVKICERCEKVVKRRTSCQKCGETTENYIDGDGQTRPIGEYHYRECHNIITGKIVKEKCQKKIKN